MTFIIKIVDFRYFPSRMWMNVITTQIYADLINSKKRETANKNSLKWKHYPKDNLYYTTKIVRIIFGI